MKTERVSLQEYNDLADLPETIYKYREWKNPYHKTILTKREIFFAAPDTFEDPLDCKNPIRYDLLTKKEINELYKHRLDLEQTISRKARREKVREQARNSKLKDKEYIRQHNEETFKEYCKRAGVLSLTANPKNISMWEKYSDNHQGFCVGFNTKKALEVIGAAGPVIYKESLPIIYPEPKDSSDNLHIKRIFYKEKKWELEQEFRAHRFREQPMNINDRTSQLRPNAYKEVILGAKMTEEATKELINSLPPELRSLPVKQAVLIGDDIIIKDLPI